ncbi:CCA tRNA nucleotidyltransferase [Varunaivibrio sulfuroxidans]|uniref:Poly(A) polymerase n=1 Tax=Varunaivibrio sulfuroxidans TaxID=1773489 RepID=A0A4R3JC25_9PROT|nr:CCA tRNA nucleotidyltransferase [Varunaivibrio sulfuroxidans]TCS62676.1 poly(A) polymerase [Varunaivibrio sulfuroxidans]WES30661.1 CCA tRNA nucleotidyltransferase [Varunaivibrio sulfuroxidans]
MDPTGQIPRQPWMLWPETQSVMAALTARGDEARFVGGCVRDSILKRPVNDIDIATPAPPETVIALLEAADIKAIPTGIDHGTITAVIGSTHFEVTTLRIDVATDGRRAQVAYTDDWTQDAARRDFTINAMSCTQDGDIFDPYGGLEDLGLGRIRFVGDARQRITEDVLRLLRFFRFQAAYGRPPLDIEARNACRNLACRLPELSGERVRGELFRILTGPNPADTLIVMREETVLDYILPEARNIARLRMTEWLSTRAVRVEGLEPSPVRRLAALIGKGGTPTDGDPIADRLKFSNKERAHLRLMLAPPEAISPDLPVAARHRMLYRFGNTNVRDLALLAWADELTLNAHLPRPRTDAWIAIVEETATWRRPEFPLKGRDLLDLGIPPGPQMGNFLKNTEAWWQDADFVPDRSACLEHLRRIAES